MAVLEKPFPLYLSRGFGIQDHFILIGSYTLGKHYHPLNSLSTIFFFLHINCLPLLLAIILFGIFSYIISKILPSQIVLPANPLHNFHLTTQKKYTLYDPSFKEKHNPPTGSHIRSTQNNYGTYLTGILQNYVPSILLIIRSVLKYFKIMRGYLVIDRIRMIR